MTARLLIYFLLCLAFHGCGVRPPVILPQLGISLQDVCEHYHVSWQWDGVTQVVLLEYKANKVKALVGSATVLIGKQKIILSAPLYRREGTIYVPEDFEAKVIRPFTMQGAGLPSVEEFSRAHMIVIDPGHGGHDHGTIFGASINEKDIVLDIAKRLRALLEGAGIKVLMTRSRDNFISLSERTEMASRSKADLFISIHVNSNQDRAVHGLIVYYIDAMAPRYLHEAQRRMNENLLIRRLNPEAGEKLRSIVGDMMDTIKASQARNLAKMIVSQVREEPGITLRGDGMRLCHFFVVRNTLIPAVLVETGFLSNRQDRSKLVLPAYRQKLAQVIACGVLAYANE